MNYHNLFLGKIIAILLQNKQNNLLIVIQICLNYYKIIIIIALLKIKIKTIQNRKEQHYRKFLKKQKVFQ